jgi:hypothetical protein
MRYQQFASSVYCGAAGPVSKMASEQEKAFYVLRFEVSRSLITVQREFRARFRKNATWCVFSKPCAVILRSELLVAHEKLGQLLLLTVYVVPV